MLKIEENSIIYVLCPGNYKTGGTELPHQLVFLLNNFGVKAYITYFGENKDLKIHPEFKKYVSSFKKIEEIVDDKNNAVIIPEIHPEFGKRYRNIQVAIWWMSVDNYFMYDSVWGVAQYFGVRCAIGRLRRGQVGLIPRKINRNYLHLYQCEYAKQFLLKNGATNIARLSDYLNSEYLDERPSYSDRRDIVLYNPSKGYDFTKKIIQAAPDVDWIPIKDMTTDQVFDLMNSAKVYIDFGNHPGKDRMPREAAMCGCCIITGNKGSAAYYEDVAIDSEFKFQNKKSNIPKIVEKIRDCINNYDHKVTQFETYRNRIRKEKDLFESDVKSIFGIRANGNGQ